MNILVLSPSRKKASDKTENTSGLAELIKNGGHAVENVRFRDFSAVLSLKLRSAAKRFDMIIIEDLVSGESDFRSRFARIIDRAERKAQSVPNTKAKIDFKSYFNPAKSEKSSESREVKTVTYMRKKTHVFTLSAGGKTAYVFTLGGCKAVALSKGADISSLGDLPEKVIELFDENCASYPDGYSLNERTLEVLNFFERHFPRKGDSRKELARKCVMITAVFAFVAAGITFIYNMYVMPMQNAAVQSDIRTVFYQTETDPVTGKKKAKALNWKAIQKQNSDIKGWIRINNTKIDYPIVQCKDDDKNYQFYLHHNHLKYSSGYGAIFIDYRSKQGLNSKNCIIHGHHMDDGSMFANLCNYGMYSGNLSFYKKAPVVRISTPKGGTETYKIFSVFKSNVDPSQGEYFDFYCNNFKSKAQFMNYVYNLRVRSLFNCPVSVNENDKIISLVTCSYEFTNGANTFRTVVVARKCRDKESPTVDVGAASLNKNPVWPQCYYSRYGGVRPTVSTFSEEFKKGKLKWYDGNGKFKGSEELPTSVEATTVPPTQAPTTVKPTVAPKNRTYTVQIISRGSSLVKKTVKAGTTVKIPKIKNYKSGGYKYTFAKWRVKGFGSRKYLSKKYSKVKVNSNVKMVAKFKKTKLSTPAPKPTKPAVKPTKPAPKPTQPPTEPPTEPETEIEETEAEE